MAIPLISVSCIPSCCSVRRPPASIGGTMIPFSNPGGYHPSPVTLSNNCGPSGVMTPVEGPIAMGANTGLFIQRPGPVGLPEVNPQGEAICSGGFGTPRRLGGPCRLDVPASACVVPVRINNTSAPEPPTVGSVAFGSGQAKTVAGQVPGSAASCVGNMSLGILIVGAVVVGLYLLSKA